MKNYILLLLTFLLVLLAKFIPFSLIIGSHGAFFSGTTSIYVLMARYSGLGVLFLSLCTLKSLSLPQLFLFLVHRMPLLFAAWSYRASNMLVSVILPMSCLLLFIVHPIGQQAWPYALYWFIPVIVYLLRPNNFFLKALEAVFVAHAVGSVVWLYTHQMDAEVWMGLIPLVAYERILMALGVVAGEYAIELFKSLKSKAGLFFNRKLT